mmetsp:Transcript_18366/g.23887  ORF Transcript_18366/g.23887 Transcript_18366/m.23887 type:complete len:757 (-) Transcript_18366:630-2900(-)
MICSKFVVGCILLVVGKVYGDEKVCPEVSSGELSFLGGDGTLVLKDLPIPFTLYLNDLGDDIDDYEVSVIGDGAGFRLNLESGDDGAMVTGKIRWREAKRRSPEADAPGRKKECNAKYPCYGQATVVISDTTGVCEDATYSFTPQVQDKNAPIIPLVVTGLLGPITGDPIITLVIGGFITRCMRTGDVWLAILRYLDTDLMTELQDFSYSALFLFTIMIAGVTGGAIKSGGVQGVANRISKIVRNSFLAQSAVYAAGFVFFIDDYSNVVIVGSTLRFITDVMRLSREKLSFLVDCTAAPIASVMPLSTWIGYEIQLIKDELDRIGYDREAAYTLFLMSIQYRFYSWFMLIFVACIVLFGRDFGPMYWAEKRARETGIVTVGQEQSNTEEAADLIPPELKPNPQVPPRALNAAIPFSLFIILFFPLLFYSGAKQAEWGGTGWNVSSRVIVGNSDSWQTLFWTCGMILGVQLIMYAVQYNKDKWGGMLLSPGKSIHAFIAGTNTMYSGLVALLIAFVFATGLKNLLIADYLVNALGDSLEVQTLPTVVFCLCALYAFATGTSWGTMLVFFQPSIALCVYLFQDKGDKPDKDLNNKRFTDIMARTIAAILGGATWGDHCSFVSDTTILSSVACGLPLWDHYLTQMPYALICGINAILFGFLPGGAGTPAGLCIFFAFLVQPLTILLMTSIPGWGGTVPVYAPAVGLVDGGIMNNIKTIGVAFKDSSEPVPAEEIPSGKEIDDEEEHFGAPPQAEGKHDE